MHLRYVSMRACVLFGSDSRQDPTSAISPWDSSSKRLEEPKGHPPKGHREEMIIQISY